jgi:hypothetical protein
LKKLLLFLLVLLLVGCGKGPGEEPIIKEPEQPTSEIEQFQDVDWTDLTFTLDGVVYTYPWSFDQLENNGWYLTEGSGDDIIEPGQSNPVWVGEMRNKKYEDYRYVDKDFLWIRVKNYSDVPKRLRDCEIVFINFHILSDWENRQLMNNPFELELPGGFTWGMTDIDALYMYGTIPVDSIETTSTCVIMPYTHQEELAEGRIDKIMHLTFDDELGLVSVSLHRYFTLWENFE